MQASHSLSDERTEYLWKDSLSFMRFLGLTLADRVPDANSIWNFREALSMALIDGVPAIEALFRRFDAALTKAGSSARAARSSARPRRGFQAAQYGAEKKAIKEGGIPTDWKAKPATLTALDGQAHKGQSRRGRSKVRLYRDPALWLQEPYRHRPRPWPDPHMGATDPARHGPLRAPDLINKQDTVSDVGGHGLPFGEE